MKKVIDNYLVEDYRQTCYTEPDEESSEDSGDDEMEDTEMDGVNPFWDTHYFYHFRDCLRRFAPMTPIAILQNLSEAAELGD